MTAPKVLNHLVNSILTEEELGPRDRLSSLVTGSPPIWVTRRSAWIFFNQVKILSIMIKVNFPSTFLSQLT